MLYKHKSKLMGTKKTIKAWMTEKNQVRSLTKKKKETINQVIMNFQSALSQNCYALKIKMDQLMIFRCQPVKKLIN